MRKLFALSIFVIAITASAFAQVTATANATAVIITPITITKTADLDFGILAVNATPGTVGLTTGSVASATGGVTLLGGTPTAAVFQVAGLAGESYSFSLPASITLQGPGVNTMVVNAFVNTASGTIPGVAPATGTEDISVGATLIVDASQAAGAYTNTTDLTATVNYN